MDILIVEDDTKVLNLLEKHLSKNFNIYTSSRIFDAKSILKRNHIDLLCLDLVLPDGSGMEFCKSIRKEYPDLKIIILTKKTDLENRIKSFEFGADDYLAKPFFPDELEVRIKKLLSLLDNSENIIRRGRLTLNLNDLSISYEKSKAILTKAESYTIAYLLNNPGVKTPTQIAKYLSTKRGKLVTKSSVVVSLKRLRDKLKNTIGMGIIKTRYSKGYYIAL